MTEPDTTPEPTGHSHRSNRDDARITASASSASDVDERLPWSLLLAYGSMAFPLAAAFIALQVIVPTHYAEATGLSLTTIGVVLLIARLCDTVSDPLIGYLSDATPARWGRRKLYVVLAAPLIAISCWFLFVPPDSAGALYLLGWTVAIYVAGTLSIVPMGTWGAELTPGYGERSRVTGTRVAFGLSGTLAALLVPVLVGGGTTAGGSDAELAAPLVNAGLADTLQAIAILVMVTLLVTTLWAAVRVPDNSRTQLPESTVKAAWQLLRKPSPCRQLLTGFLLNAVGNAIPATLFLLYVTHVLQVPDQAGPLLFLYFICAALSVPFWVRVARRIGKHQTWSVAIVMAVLFFLWTPFLSAGDLMWFYVIVAATGFATGADLALPAAINADLIEWDALETGYRRPALFFALWGTATKLSYALAIGIAFPLLEATGFSATQNNSSAALGWLGVLYGGPCIAFKLAALWRMNNYPITAEVHRDIRRQLAERG